MAGCCTLPGSGCSHPTNNCSNWLSALNINFRAFTFLFTVVLSVSTHALSAEMQTISCSPSGSDAKLTHSNCPSTPVVLKGRSDVCELGFEFLPHPDQPLAGIVLAAPIELSLQAKNVVYRVSFHDGSAKNIGELPVSSEQTTGGVFLNVFQEGGSAFLEKYVITPNSVNHNPITLELVIDGRLCVQNKGDVWNLEVAVKRTCGKITTASFTNPLCLVHKTGKARLSHRSVCKELEDRWRVR